jgi:hypothetical protein
MTPLKVLNGEIDTDVTKRGEAEQSDWEKRFDEKFVTIDHGPTGDDHDKEPDEWNDYARLNDDEEQIERLKSFIASEIKLAKDTAFKEGQKSVKSSFDDGWEHGMKTAIRLMQEKLQDVDGDIQS